MRFAPMSSPANLDIERHVELLSRFRGICHHLLDDRSRLFLLAVGHFEYELVMHLEEHLHAAEPRFCQRIVHPRHGALYKVGAGSLDRRVDCGALGAATD